MLRLGRWVGSRPRAHGQADVAASVTLASLDIQDVLAVSRVIGEGDKGERAIGTAIDADGAVTTVVGDGSIRLERHGCEDGNPTVNGTEDGRHDEKGATLPAEARSLGKGLEGEQTESLNGVDLVLGVNDETSLPLSLEGLQNRESDLLGVQIDLGT